MRRRTFAIGCTLALAGCLGRSNPLVDDGENGDGGDDGDDDGDTDDQSIDGRLHNESDDAVTIELTVEDEDGNTVRSGAEDVDADDTVNVPALAAPGDTRTVTATAGETSASETFTFDVEPTPDRIDGYVEVTFEGEGELSIAFTPREDFADASS